MEAVVKFLKLRYKKKIFYEFQTRNNLPIFMILMNFDKI